MEFILFIAAILGTSFIESIYHRNKVKHLEREHEQELIDVKVNLNSKIFNLEIENGKLKIIIDHRNKQVNTEIKEFLERVGYETP